MSFLIFLLVVFIQNKGSKFSIKMQSQSRLMHTDTWTLKCFIWLCCVIIFSPTNKLGSNKLVVLSRTTSTIMIGNDISNDYIIALLTQKIHASSDGCVHQFLWVWAFWFRRYCYPQNWPNFPFWPWTIYSPWVSKNLFD